MMVAMADHFSCDIIGKNYAKTDFWFWKMIENLDLIRITDDSYDFEYVKKRVEMMMDRNYRKNGEGGMFPLKRAKEDQRKIELWYQLCAWFEESYGTEIIRSRWK